MPTAAPCASTRAATPVRRAGRGHRRRDAHGGGPGARRARGSDLDDRVDARRARPVRRHPAPRRAGRAPAPAVPRAAEQHVRGSAVRGRVHARDLPAPPRRSRARRHRAGSTYQEGFIPGVRAAAHDLVRAGPYRGGDGRRPDGCGAPWTSASRRCWACSPSDRRRARALAKTQSTADADAGNPQAGRRERCACDARVVHERRIESRTAAGWALPAAAIRSPTC